MSISMTNYSHKAINAAHKHYDAFLNNTPVSMKNFELDLKINIDLNMLNIQAHTFAYFVRNDNNMKFETRLSAPLEKVETILYECYIYSFVKCLFNAFFRSEINSDMFKGYAFEGHCKFYHLLRAQYLVEEKGGIVYTINIDYGNEKHRRALFILIFGSFPFLRRYLDSGYDSFGTRAFFITDYENYLLRMRNSVSDLKSKSNKGNNPIGNQNNKDQNIDKDSTIPSSISDQPQSQTPNSKKKNNFNQNRNNSANLNNKLGLLEIVELNDQSCSNITNFENNPVLNAFISEDGGTQYYIPIVDDKPIIYNASYFFNKANFITLSNNQDMKILGRAYQRQEITDRQLHFICSEVYTNTGVKPQNVIVKRDKKDKISKIPVSQIYDYLDKIVKDKLNEVFIEILEGIAEKVTTEDFELGTLLNKILEPFVKQQN